MSMLTPEGLKALAERLDWAFVHESAYRFKGPWSVPGGYCSDGDLLLSILERAIEMQLRLKLNAGNFQGMGVKNNADRLWSAEFETYAYDGNGPRVKGASAPTVLEAVILAFLQVPTRSAGG